MKTFKWLLVTTSLLCALTAKAQDEEGQKVFEIYGFIMADVGYNFNQIHPNWYDVVRPTQLPGYKNQYAPDGNVYFSVRQTRFGAKGYLPIKNHVLKTTFEFELFGTGADAGQTTFRLRHAYAEYGHFGVGQYWSPFMDIDVFPNTVEYWGPSGMAFFRNIQIRYMPLIGEHHKMAIALERPGASADQGIYSGRIELADVKARFPAPDLSAEYRYAGKLGYIELAGIVRYIKWEDQGTDSFDLSGHAIGWGLNLSSNIKFTKNITGRFQLLYGEGVENYMNDAPVDVGIENDFGNPTAPVKGVALPVLGVVAFVDINWTDNVFSSLGYSMIDINNSEAQTPDAFHRGHYAIVNLGYSPFKNANMWVEGQFGRRENFSDDFDTNIFKLQLSFKYNFGHEFYKKAKPAGA